MTAENIHETAVASNTRLDSGAKIWKHAFVSNSILHSHASIGDYSRVYNSQLGEYVNIDRYDVLKNVNIGRYSYIGKDSHADHCDIGAFCSISWHVSLGGANHDYSKVTTHAFLWSDFCELIDSGQPMYDRFDGQKCTINNDVWIAANACVCQNLEIGTGAVVAAGAVVTKDVAPYTIVAGVPAHPIKKRFSDEIIAEMVSIPWWDLPSNVIKENIHLFNQQPSKKVRLELKNLCETYL